MIHNLDFEQDLTELPPWFNTRDESQLAVRVIHPDDAGLLLELFEHLSSETRRRRFHTGADHVSEARKQEIAQQLASVDNCTQGGAILAIDIDDKGQEHIVGVARLARPEGKPDAPEAEMAAVVRDDFQGRGVGTELLYRLILLAKQMQIRTAQAVIDADNAAVIKISRSCGLPIECQTSHAETEIRIAVPQ
jgi:acetyltransferase